MKHLDEAKQLWETIVPASGQAKTQQGELLRSVVKLEDEWSVDGNAHWDKDFMHFVEYLREHLTLEDSFTDDQKREINQDLDAVGDPEHGGDKQERFDRLTDRVVEWIHAHPEPVPHEHLPDLNR